MKVKIPKDLVGASYPTVMTIELNNFNADIFCLFVFKDYEWRKIALEG